MSELEALGFCSPSNVSRDILALDLGAQPKLEDKDTPYVLIVPAPLFFGSSKALTTKSDFFFSRSQLCEYHQSARYAAETTITMASTLEAEAPHNSFDVCTATTPQKPRI